MTGAGRIRRTGEVVRRPLGFWSPAVHHLLRYLQNAGYPEPPDRRRRIEVFCDAYGIGVPGDIVDRVAEQQRLALERCAALGRRGIEPQAAWVRDGYLDTVQARIRWTEALRL